MGLRRLAALHSGGLLTAGLSLTLGGTAHASDPTVPAATWNEIYVPFDNIGGNQLCVDVTNGSTSPGTALQFYSCQGYSSGGLPQRWQFAGELSHELGGFLVLIRNVGNGLCVGSQGSSLNSGVRLVQESCRQAPFWLIRAQNDDGTDPLIELQMLIPGTKTSSNLCLAAGDMGDDNHTPLVATTCQPFTDNLSQVLELG
jgi:hypothetical protein